GASLLVCYEVLTPAGQVCARAASSIVKVDAGTSRPVRFTAEEREALAPLLDAPVTFRRCPAPSHANALRRGCPSGPGREAGRWRLSAGGPARSGPAHLPPLVSAAG